jgi:Uma2 family endonuclease
MVLAVPLVLRARPTVPVSDEDYFAFCQHNPFLRVECTADGEWILMPPTAFDTGDRNAELTMQVRQWAKRDGMGVATDSNTGFVLPNGAKRAPDAAWVLRSRIAALPRSETQRFLPLCPDFAAELRSASDSLQDTQAKMAEYIANGARLGLLIDPSARKVYVYRPGAPVQELDDPVTVAGDPELPGFTLNARDVFQTSF